MATNIPPVSAGQLIESAAWGNQVRTEVSNLEANKVSKSGATMTGALLLPAQNLLNAANAVTRKDYVDDVRADSMPRAGGTMTGTLTINGTSDLGIRLRGTSPYLDFYTEAGTERWGYIQGSATIGANGGILLNAVNADGDVHRAISLYGSLILLGKIESNAAAAGAEVMSQGRISSTVADDNGYACLVGRHVGEMDADGKYFALWQRTNGTTAGSITQDAGNSVKYNTTSDYRLKNVIGPVPDATGRVLALVPRQLEWKQAPGSRFDGFLAHEVTPPAPYAVTGEYDAVLPPDNEFAPNGIDPQQLDLAKLVPLVVAALQETINRVAVLEGA